MLCLIDEYSFLSSLNTKVVSIMDQLYWSRNISRNENVLLEIVFAFSRCFQFERNARIYLIIKENLDS